MDAEYIARVVARMQPYVREGTLRKSRMDRVFNSLGSAPERLRSEAAARIRVAGVVIVDDAPAAVMDPAIFEPPRHPDSVATANARGRNAVSFPEPEAAVLAPKAPERLPGPDRADLAAAAARLRIELDRFTRQHAKVLLTADEEVGLALLVRGESGEPLPAGGFGGLEGEARQAAESLVLHNQGLVHAVARKYAPAGMEYEDAFQHGIVGLIRAVEMFDPAMGNKFSTYAMNWVRQAITRGIANESRLIRLPVHMVERVKRVWATRARLTVDGEPPNVSALAQACELSAEQTIECLMLGPEEALSLDQPAGDGETTLGDLFEFEDGEEGPDDQVMFKLLQEQLTAVLDTLSEREAGIISMRFGLTDGEPKTLEEIGGVYGVTRERIRQIEKKTMSKLRHQSRSTVLRPYL